MDGRIVPLLIAALLVLAVGMAVSTMEDQGTGGTQAITTTAGPTGAAQESWTITVTNVNPGQDNAATQPETVEYNRGTTGATSVMGEETQDSGANTSNGMDNSGMQSGTTMGSPAEEKPGDTGDSGMPEASQPGEHMVQRKSMKVKVGKVVTGKEGWVEVKVVTIVLDEARGTLEANVTIALPDPCWASKASMQIQGGEAVITITAERSPGAMCIQVVKEDTIMLSTSTDTMPTYLRIIVVVGGEQQEIVLKLPTEDFNPVADKP